MCSIYVHGLPTTIYRNRTETALPCKMDKESVISSPNNPICKISQKKYPFTRVCQRWKYSYQSCQGRHTYVGISKFRHLTESFQILQRRVILGPNHKCQHNFEWHYHLDAEVDNLFRFPQCFYRNPRKMGLRFKVGTIFVFSTPDNPTMGSFSVKKILENLGHVSTIHLPLAVALLTKTR